MNARQTNIVLPERLDEVDRFLVEEYPRTSRPVDQLAYSDEFETLFDRYRRQFNRDDSIADRRALFSRLIRLRKAGKLRSPSLDEPSVQF